MLYYFGKKIVKIYALFAQNNASFLKKTDIIIPSANGNYGNRVASYSAKEKRKISRFLCIEFVEAVLISEAFIYILSH